MDDTGRNRTRHPAAVHPSDKVPQQPVSPQRLSGKESRGEPAGVGRAGLRYVLFRCRRGVCRPRPPVCLRSGRIRHTFIVPVRQPHLHRTGKTPVGKLAGTASRKERGYTGTTGSRTRTGSRTAIPPALPHPRHAAQRHSSRRNRTESMGGKSRRISQE